MPGAGGTGSPVTAASSDSAASCRARFLLPAAQRRPSMSSPRRSMTAVAVKPPVSADSATRIPEVPGRWLSRPRTSTAR